MKDILSFQEFKKGLIFRIIIFAFMGIGWDICMTFLQQVVSGRADQDALCPSSMWMFLAYGSLPLFFYPLVALTKHFRFPYTLRILVLLSVFYSVELLFGITMRSFGIMPWNYDWYLSPCWTLKGIITWHPAILAAWIVFLVLVEWLDTVLRKSYPLISGNLEEFWKDI
jgi:hypothetical protein